jgi:hypothetical protein
MKNLNFTTKTAIALYAMLAVVFSSCSQSVGKCENPTNGKAVLVAYRGLLNIHIYGLKILKLIKYMILGVLVVGENLISISEIQYQLNIVMGKLCFINTLMLGNLTTEKRDLFI